MQSSLLLTSAALDFVIFQNELLVQPPSGFALLRRPRLAKGAASSAVIRSTGCSLWSHPQLPERPCRLCNTPQRQAQSLVLEATWAATTALLHHPPPVTVSRRAVTGAASLPAVSKALSATSAAASLWKVSVSAFRCFLGDLKSFIGTQTANIARSYRRDMFACQGAKGVLKEQHCLVC